MKYLDEICGQITAGRKDLCKAHIRKQNWVTSPAYTFVNWLAVTQVTITNFSVGAVCLKEGISSGVSIFKKAFK